MTISRLQAPATAPPTGQERVQTATAKALSKVLHESPTTAARVAQIDSNAERDSYAVTTFSDVVDRSLHAAAARFTLGLSPAALAEAYFDWATHLLFSPGKRIQLVDKAIRKSVRLANYARHCALGSVLNKDSSAV